MHIQARLHLAAIALIADPRHAGIGVDALIAQALRAPQVRVHRGALRATAGRADLVERLSA
ncbi:MAG: hypothetical protein ACRCVA_27100, partial [Phreatobacter sp.]